MRDLLLQLTLRPRCQIAADENFFECRYFEANISIFGLCKYIKGTTDVMSVGRYFLINFVSNPGK
jgi:hypothetical protein